MRVVVTGGAGFIGSHLVDALVARGDDVRVLDNLSSGKKEHVYAAAEFFERDICEEDSIRPLLCDIDIVFHLAAIPSIHFSIEQPWEAHRHNLDGTLGVLRAAKEGGVKRFVFVSSCAVYGENGLRLQSEQAPLAPQSPYAVHKIAGEAYCRLFSTLWDLPAVSLRFFNVYGSNRQSLTDGYAAVMRAFGARAAAGLPLEIYGDGAQTRDFVHWKDAVQALVLAGQSEQAVGEVINVGSGRETSIHELADYFGGRRTHLPARLGEIRHIAADITKAKKVLGWEPKIPLKEGIREYLAE